MSCDRFIRAMSAAGIEPFKDLDLVDGHLTRFRVRGDKPGSRNGWCVWHSLPVSAGAFGSWRTGQSEVWRDQSDVQLSAEQRAQQREQLRAMQRTRDEQITKMRSEARQKAARLWKLSHPATDAHPYLRAKGVQAYGVRQLRDMLVVPLRDADGALHSLQFIGADGSKRFLTGGRISGCYFAIGKPQRELLLGEGLATCSTLHQATGSAVAVCFNCGNLEPVARALRAKFPRLRLVICADNDTATPGNPGVTHATAAAKAVGALLAVPRFDNLTT